MKIQNRNIVFIVASLLLCGCFKKYKDTRKVCDDKLFVEIFNVNPAGVDAAYLTDSTNFTLFLGKFDNEHENYTCYCTGDSVIIKKLATVDTTGTRQPIQTTIYNLKNLKQGIKTPYSTQ